jgi:hypothetical protein
MLKTRARLHPEVLFTPLHNGEAVLLDLRTKGCFGLNETARRIWQLMAEGLELGEIAQALTVEFEVEPDEAERHVVSLMEDLVGRDLVTSEAAGSEGQARGI